MGYDRLRGKAEQVVSEWKQLLIMTGELSHEEELVDLITDALKGEERTYGTS